MTSSQLPNEHGSIVHLGASTNLSRPPASLLRRSISEGGTSGSCSSYKDKRKRHSGESIPKFSILIEDTDPEDEENESRKGSKRSRSSAHEPIEDLDTDQLLSPEPKTSETTIHKSKSAPSNLQTLQYDSEIETENVTAEHAYVAPRPRLQIPDAESSQLIDLARNGGHEDQHTNVIIVNHLCSDSQIADRAYTNRPGSLAIRAASEDTAAVCLSPTDIGKLTIDSPLLHCAALGKQQQRPETNTLSQQASPIAVPEVVDLTDSADELDGTRSKGHTESQVKHGKHEEGNVMPMYEASNVTEKPRSKLSSLFVSRSGPLKSRHPLREDRRTIRDDGTGIDCEVVSQPQQSSILARNNSRFLQTQTKSVLAHETYKGRVQHSDSPSADNSSLSEIHSAFVPETPKERVQRLDSRSADCTSHVKVHSDVAQEILQSSVQHSDYPSADHTTPLTSCSASVPETQQADVQQVSILSRDNIGLSRAIAHSLSAPNVHELNKEQEHWLCSDNGLHSHQRCGRMHSASGLDEPHPSVFTRRYVSVELTDISAPSGLTPCDFSGIAPFDIDIDDADCFDLDFTFDGLSTDQELDLNELCSIISLDSESPSSDPTSPIPRVVESASSSDYGSSQQKSSRSVRSHRGEFSRGQLWKFLLESLCKAEYNPDSITWEDEERGIFRIVCRDSISRLWAQKRGKLNMEYDIMARAIRHYYSKRVIIPVRLQQKRMVFQFGPNARGWRELIDVYSKAM